MLTKDLAEREVKYNTSQAALRSTNDDAQTFERKYNVAQASVNELTTQLDEAHRQLQESQSSVELGTKQLRALQKLAKKSDRVLISRVKELARLSSEWDHAGGAGERLRAKVAEEMTELVKAWTRFEGEYEEGIVNDGT